MGIDLTIVTTLISPIITIACLAIGFVLKMVVPGEKINHFIPLIVLVLGIAFNVWYLGAFTFEVCVAGAISGLASCGLYEVFAQILKLQSPDEDNEEDAEEDDPIEGQHVAEED